MTANDPFILKAEASSVHDASSPSKNIAPSIAQDSLLRDKSTLFTLHADAEHAI